MPGGVINLKDYSQLTGGRNNTVYHDETHDLVYKVFRHDMSSDRRVQLDAALNEPQRLADTHNRIHSGDATNQARVVTACVQKRGKSQPAFCSPYIEGKVLNEMTFAQAQQVQDDMWHIYREHGYVILDAATVKQGAGNVKIDHVDGKVKWLDFGLALKRGETASDAWYASATQQLSRYLNDGQRPKADAAEPTIRMGQANMLAVKDIAKILYLAEAGLLHNDPELGGAPGNVIPNDVIDQWRQLDRTELKWLCKLLGQIRNPYSLSPISREQINQMTRANIQLAQRWMSAQLFSETLPARWQGFCALEQGDRDALRDCQAVLERFAGDMPDINLSKLQSEHAITSEFIRALKAVCDYLERHDAQFCNPFSYHGRHGRDATLKYLQLLLLSDRQSASIIPLMRNWVADKPFYSDCFSDSGARSHSRAAFVWASGLMQIQSAAIPDRRTGWAQLRPEQRRAALTIMAP